VIGGATGTLARPAFVAVSINLDRIIEEKGPVPRSSDPRSSSSCLALGVVCAVWNVWVLLIEILR
jgi:hypothetical protein